MEDSRDAIILPVRPPLSQLNIMYNKLSSFCHFCHFCRWLSPSSSHCTCVGGVECFVVFFVVLIALERGVSSTLGIGVDTAVASSVGGAETP